MGKGSGRRKQEVTDAELEKAWDSIFAGHPSDEQFDRVRGKTVLTKPTVDEDDYGNVLPSNIDIKRDEAIKSALDDWAGKPKKPKKDDPDRFVDDIGDS